MSLSPETATNPIASPPADRPTMTIEQWARIGLGLLFSDNKLDQNEMQVLHSLFAEISMRAQNGGIGQGATPPMEQPPQDTALAPSPMEMNQNTSDYGTSPDSSVGPRENYQ